MSLRERQQLCCDGDKCRAETAEEREAKRSWPEHEQAPNHQGFAPERLPYGWRVLEYVVAWPYGRQKNFGHPNRRLVGGCTPCSPAAAAPRRLLECLSSPPQVCEAHCSTCSKTEKLRDKDAADKWISKHSGHLPAEEAPSAELLASIFGQVGFRHTASLLLETVRRRWHVMAHRHRKLAPLPGAPRAASRTLVLAAAEAAGGRPARDWYRALQRLLAVRIRPFDGHCSVGRVHGAERAQLRPQRPAVQLEVRGAAQ